jgi:hypothetical protein
MKLKRLPVDQGSSSSSDGFRLVISEKSFTALLKAILLLTLTIRQGQGVIRQISSLDSIQPVQIISNFLGK